MRAVLRRAEGRRARGVMRVGELTLDPSTRAVRLSGRRVELAAKEFALLQALAEQPTRVYRKQELLRDVWGYLSPGNTRTLDAHAYRLRRKLRPSRAAVDRERARRRLQADGGAVSWAWSSAGSGGRSRWPPRWTLRRRMTRLADAEHELRGAVTAIGLAARARPARSSSSSIACGRARGPGARRAGRTRATARQTSSRPARAGAGERDRQRGGARGGAGGGARRAVGGLAQLELATAGTRRGLGGGPGAARGLLIAKRAARRARRPGDRRERGRVTRTVVELPERTSGARTPRAHDRRSGGAACCCSASRSSAAGWRPRRCASASGGRRPRVGPLVPGGGRAARPAGRPAAAAGRPRVRRVPARFAPPDALGRAAELARRPDGGAGGGGRLPDRGHARRRRTRRPRRCAARRRAGARAGGGGRRGAGGRRAGRARRRARDSTQRRGRRPGARSSRSRTSELLGLRAGGEEAAAADARPPAPTALATLRVSARQAVYLTAAANFADEIRLLVRPPGDRKRVGSGRRRRSRRLASWPSRPAASTSDRPVVAAQAAPAPPSR